MSSLTPLTTLYESPRGEALPLPAELVGLYGALSLPAPQGRPYVIANFVSSLDGVVAMPDVPRYEGGGEISGHNSHDQMVMGLLRAAAGAVVVGAGTLRADPGHIWTAEYVYGPLAAAFATLRANLREAAPPLNVIVTAQGTLDFGLPVFRSGTVPVLVVTTDHGAKRLRKEAIPPHVRIAAAARTGRAGARAILDAIAAVRQTRLILVEGGPHLMGDFFAEGCLDEQFLTLAPQVVGRDDAWTRPGLVEGRRLAPDRPVWGNLVSVKRGGSHLFMRYALPAAADATS